MEKIDSLILKAKRKQGIRGLSLGFISPSPHGKWTSRGDISDSSPLKNTKQVTFLCDSLSDAEQALSDLGDRYAEASPDEAVPLLIESREMG